MNDKQLLPKSREIRHLMIGKRYKNALHIRRDVSIVQQCHATNTHR